MLTRRQFAIGAAAMTSASIVGWRIAETRASQFNTPLAIPRLIDAAKQGNAVSLKIAAGRHAFVKGKPARTYGYSAPILGPVIRMRRGDKIQMTVENALDTVTTVHWHGLLVPGDCDGGPQELEQISLGSNRGDSQCFINERGCRH
jgi:cuproxidase